MATTTNKAGSLPVRRFRLEVEAGDRIPDGWGVAYRAHGRNVSVCFPIPLNVILGAARRAWHEVRWWFKAPPWNDRSARDLAMEQRGFALGYAQAQREWAKKFEEASLLRWMDW